MASFPGGSAWAMAKDVGEGFVLVNERTFVRFEAGQLDQLAFELDRALREVRGEAVEPDNQAALQQKNRKILRINGALTMLRSYQQRRFRRSAKPHFDGNT